jgi:hypothetical protein
MDVRQLYTQIGMAIPGAVESQLFGKPCFKMNGKAFISLFEGKMVFKLTGDVRSEALSLDGTNLFDPSKKGRPMKEWIEVPEDYSDRWPGFAQAAAAYVSSLTNEK